MSTVKTETWYVMEDGSSGDPREISEGPDGRLVHSDGRAVAYAPHGPRSRSVEVDDDPGPDGAAGDAGDGEAAKEMKPSRRRRGYKTRAAG